MHLHELPPRLLRELRAAGRSASADGVRLFVFGSFARGDARPNSDLDLGFVVASGGEPARDSIRRLRDRVDRLPTIRAVDLVDFATTTSSFRAHALKWVVPLST